MVKFNNEWDEILAPLLSDEKYLKIREFLKTEYSTHTVYPDMHDIFNCFKKTDFKDIKAVILGQDPSHERGQAQGFSFSVPAGVKFPPSLKNIFKELSADLGYEEPKSGDLTKWTKEGVLLLNTVLTVREGAPNSHKNCGWTWFTDEVIKIISDKLNNVVFILWGANARAKKELIDKNKHFIIESAHPSPFSCAYGFFGSKPFSRANDYLIANNIAPINWNLN